LQNGANPNGPNPASRGTALDYLIGSYARSAKLGTCIGLLLNAGGFSRYNLPGVLDTIQNRVDRLAGRLDANPALVHQTFSELDSAPQARVASCYKAQRFCMWRRNTAVWTLPGFCSTAAPM
jgi:hypothetical protein